MEDDLEFQHRSKASTIIEQSQLCMFWAKLGSATWPDEYHPVFCHLLDVGQVTRRIWNDVLRPKVRTWVTARLGLADETAAGAWLAYWVAAHDIGKVTPGFQYRCNKHTELLRDRLLGFGYDFPVGQPPHHGTTGAAILAHELPSFWGDPRLAQPICNNIAVAVGGHHGVFPTNWNGYASALGTGCWAAARRNILAELAQFFRVTDLPPPDLAAANDQSVWMFLAGLTSVADWIGSNVEFFPLAGKRDLADCPFDVCEYFCKAAKQAADALERLGWLGRAETTSAVTFAELFPVIKEPRPLQAAVEAIVANMPEPSLLIVEAPMGEGKTEAVWFASACWDRRGGQGTYVALPTMANSNQMFDRVGVFLKADAGKKNLMLQHGKAAINDRFEKLKYAAAMYDDEKRPSAVVAEGWFAANKKHGMLASYGVGTIDQAFSRCFRRNIPSSAYSG